MIRGDKICEFALMSEARKLGSCWSFLISLEGTDALENDSEVDAGDSFRLLHPLVADSKLPLFACGFSLILLMRGEFWPESLCDASSAGPLASLGVIFIFTVGLHTELEKG
jgi:hypothetical protein